jgi:putative membrane protein insertion efficiency factor
MGHRHTPEEHCGESGVRNGDGRFVAPAAERVSNSPRSFGVRVTLAALRFYKAYLSVLVGGSCRFVPTCSKYGYEAVERFGVARGSWLTLKRLLRCHPLSGKFGYDPVPETWKKSHPSTASPNEAHW